MHYISSVKFNIVMAGRKVTEIVPSKGLRQGDPLSPYLFIVAANVLSKMMIAFEGKGEIKGIKLARGCPVLTHCFFSSDDSFFFLRANKENGRRMKEVLNEYCKASRQLKNIDKSCIFFSPNTPVEVRDEISSTLGIVQGNTWVCW